MFAPTAFGTVKFLRMMIKASTAHLSKELI